MFHIFPKSLAPLRILRYSEFGCSEFGETYFCKNIFTCFWLCENNAFENQFHIILKLRLYWHDQFDLILMEFWTF